MTEFLTRDGNLPPYLMFPRFLLDSDLNETAKLLYMVLLDRARLSQRNEGWTDDQGRVFLYYTVQELGRTIHKGRTVVQDALGKLEKAGLIVRQRQGVRKANRIYVKCLTDGIPVMNRPENRPYDNRKTSLVTTGKPVANKNYRTKTTKQINGNYDCGEDESL